MMDYIYFTTLVILFSRATSEFIGDGFVTTPLPTSSSTTPTMPPMSIRETPSCQPTYAHLENDLSCDFATNFCKYSQFQSELMWERWSTANGGWLGKVPARSDNSSYLTTNLSNWMVRNKTAVLKSPEISLKTVCVEVWYSLPQTKSNLRIDIVTSLGHSKNVFDIVNSINRGTWTTLSFIISRSANYKLQFSTTKIASSSLVGLDNIKVYSKELTTETTTPTRTATTTITTTPTTISTSTTTTTPTTTTTLPTTPTRTTTPTLTTTLTPTAASTTTTLTKRATPTTTPLPNKTARPTRTTTPTTIYTPTSTLSSTTTTPTTTAMQKTTTMQTTSTTTIRTKPTTIFKPMASTTIVQITLTSLMIATTTSLINLSTLTNTAASKVTEVEKQLMVNCGENNWNIRLQWNQLNELYPDLINDDIFLGDQSCVGTRSGDYLVFNGDYTECRTQKQSTDQDVTYSNTLIYAVHDPVFRFIIKEYRFEIQVKCVMSKDEEIDQNIHNGHIHNGNTGHSATASGHFAIQLSFFNASNYKNELDKNALAFMVGDNIFVKAQTTSHDSDVRMRLSYCYTKPSKDASDTYIFYLIKNGCPTNPNVKILSITDHETRFYFQDFDYYDHPDSMYLHCHATFCKTNERTQSCDPVCH